MKNKKKDKRVDVEFTDECLYLHFSIQYRHPTERSDGNNFQLMDVEHNEIKLWKKEKQNRDSKVRELKKPHQKKEPNCRKMIKCLRKKGKVLKH